MKYHFIFIRSKEKIEGFQKEKEKAKVFKFYYQL